MAAKRKCKKDYIDLLKEMIVFYRDPVNSNEYEFQRYWIEKGFTYIGFKNMFTNGFSFCC